MGRVLRAWRERPSPSTIRWRGTRWHWKSRESSPSSREDDVAMNDRKRATLAVMKRRRDEIGFLDQGHKCAFSKKQASRTVVEGCIQAPSRICSGEETPSTTYKYLCAGLVLSTSLTNVALSQRAPACLAVLQFVRELGVLPKCSWDLVLLSSCVSIEPLLCLLASEVLLVPDRHTVGADPWVLVGPRSLTKASKEDVRR